MKKRATLFNIRAAYANNDTKRFGSFSSLISFLLLGVLMFILFFVFKGIYNVLYFGAPILLIFTLFVNYRVVFNYFINLINLFRRDVLSGIIKMAFTIFCYPLVIGWLFIKAIFFFKIDQVQQHVEKQSAVNQKTLFTDYEEISSKKINNGNP